MNRRPWETTVHGDCIDLYDTSAKVYSWRALLFYVHCMYVPAYIYPDGKPAEKPLVEGLSMSF